MSDLQSDIETSLKRVRTEHASRGSVAVQAAALGAGLGVLGKYIARLEKRVAELEKSSPLEYVGVHESGKTYRRGQFATYAGSVWHCERTTVQRPGDSNAWVLAVKAGRDAR